MNDNQKRIALLILGGAFIIVVGMTLANRPASVPQVTDIPETQSPVMRVVVSRACDFVTISKVTTALCTDGTEWAVSETTVSKAPLFGAQPVMAAEPVNPAQPILDEIAADEVAPTNYAVKPVRDDAVAIAATTADKALEESDTGYISMNIRYSHYWPPLGGPNCSNFVGGKCISNMANGQPWAPYVDIAVACPPEWPFGRKVIFEGNTYTCMDRGGKIKYVEGIPWIDFLTPKAAYPYGSVITVQVSK